MVITSFYGGSQSSNASCEITPYSQSWPDTLLEIQSEGDRSKLLKRSVLDLYGTMGSLTDLLISRANGHEVVDEKAANIQLRRMVFELWDQASRL